MTVVILFILIPNKSSLLFKIGLYNKTFSRPVCSTVELSIRLNIGFRANESAAPMRRRRGAA